MGGTIELSGVVTDDLGVSRSKQTKLSRERAVAGIGTKTGVMVSISARQRQSVVIDNDACLVDTNHSVVG